MLDIVKNWLLVSTFAFDELVDSIDANLVVLLSLVNINDDVMLAVDVRIPVVVRITSGEPLAGLSVEADRSDSVLVYIPFTVDCLVVTPTFDRVLE